MTTSMEAKLVYDEESSHQESSSNISIDMVQTKSFGENVEINMEHVTKTIDMAQMRSHEENVEINKEHITKTIDMEQTRSHEENVEINMEHATKTIDMAQTTSHGENEEINMEHVTKTMDMTQTRSHEESVEINMEHVTKTIESKGEHIQSRVGQQKRKEGMDANQSPDVVDGDAYTRENLLTHPEKGDGDEALYTIYIDRKEQKPLPNYGGYRNIKNGVRYLNAIAQTEWEKKKKKKEGLITRENLKPGQKKAMQQTDREAWTQMDKPGVILDNRGDYVLIPGPYFTSDDWDEVRVEAAIIIQKYVRGSIARRTAHRIRAYAKERKEFWEEQERKRKHDADEHLKYEIQRRMNPRSGDDFDILYTELASWCAQELSKLNASAIVGMERRKAVKELLLKVYYLPRTPSQQLQMAKRPEKSSFLKLLNYLSICR